MTDNRYQALVVFSWLWESRPLKRPRRSVMRLKIRNKYHHTWLAIQNITEKEKKYSIKSGMTISKLWLYLATDNHLLNLRKWELLVRIMPILCAMIRRPLQSKFTYLSPFHSYNSPVWLEQHYLHFYMRNMRPRWVKWFIQEHTN